jgi:hypothetical protein
VERRIMTVAAELRERAINRRHKCHALGCERPCAPAHLMCSKCWATTPDRFRRDVWRWYTAGQERGGEIKPECHVAAVRAIAAQAVRSGVLSKVGALEWLQKRGAPVRPRQLAAISLAQPWAFMVAEGLKDVHTCGWETPHRGPLAVHAAEARGDASARGNATVEMVRQLDLLERAEMLARRPTLGELRAQAGRVVAVVEMTGCRPSEGHPSEWVGTGGEWVWEFGQARAVKDGPLVPCAGSMFSLDPRVAAAIWARLA